MIKSIMIPVDLEHKEALEKAIRMAVEIAKTHTASVTLVGVGGSEPSAVAHNPDEFATKLAAFASEVSARHGIEVASEAIHDNDVVIELGTALLVAAEKIGADLIVIASHIPGFIEHIFASNAGYVASHAKCSVFVVR